jgi:hypothetical protein
VRNKRFWGGLLACGVTAGLLTTPTSAATSTTVESSSASSAAAACASGAQESQALTGHSGTAFLTNVATRQSEHYTFYMAAEGADTNSILRATTVAGCYDGAVPNFARARVRYTTDPGSALAGTDYTHVTAPNTPSNPTPGTPDQTGWICNDIHANGCDPPRSPNDPGQRPTPVPLLQSPGGDAVKSFRIRLTAAQIDQHDDGPLLAFSLNNTSPQGRVRTVHIIDDDGASRFSLEPTFNNSNVANPYSRREFGSSTELWLPVFRAGSQTTATQVNYELVPSGDHPATEGPANGSNTDFTDLTEGTVQFSTTPTNPPTGGDTGPRLAWIKIRIKNDQIREEDETFDVNLVDHNNAGGAVSTTVTILNDDTQDPGPEMHPFGKLHHPKLNYKYPRNYPYLNEIHLFTQNARRIGYNHDDYDDWKVLFADLALRKRFKNGTCQWWTGSKWINRGCSNHRWFRMKVGGGEDYFLHKVKHPMRPSVKKSPVRDYKVWSRWFDAQGNESTLRKGKNMNVFEVIPGTRACKRNPFGRKCKPIKP